ncbi:hypothetical protein EK21DRAFT_112892 [Setomelanomma holmii]|uniref:Uncharacterized protein n=1 Tax=Setomelanomma holmii TaxID=210430 RepID=A0A9P4LLS9_9PLEO|nr:hypothetical protein EK21DRAFT_112892 [Setomelanomma holmii]
MSQERPPQDVQCYQRSAATHTPQPQAHSPNMFPPDAFGFSAGTNHGSAIPTELPFFFPIYTQGIPGQYPSPGSAAFRGFDLPILQPHAAMSSPHPSQHRQGHVSPSSHASPTFPPYPIPGHKRSRLPSNDVGRKVPRKAVASSPPPEDPPRSSRTKAKLARSRVPKRKTQDRNDSPIAVPAQSAVNGGAASIATPTPTGFRKLPSGGHGLRPPSGRSRPVVLDDDIEGRNENESDSPKAATESDEDISMHTPSTTNSPVRQDRPRPQHDYPIPKELEGIHRALGEDNWNEYLILQEEKWMGKVTEAQFDAKTRSIFAVFDERIGKSLEKKMKNMVVKPVMERHAGDQSGLF